MTWRVLVSAPHLLPALEEFRPQLAQEGIELVEIRVEQALSEQELLPLVGDVDGIICGDDEFTGQVLKAAPRLKVISKWGTGVDSIDRETAQRLGIRVYNTPNAFGEPVADTVMGYILCFARKLPWMDREVKGGAWVKRPLVALGETTLGIVGIGAIGGAVARRAVAFGTHILGNDNAPVSPQFLAETGTSVVGLDTLLAEADFITLHCDLNQTSFHLVGARELALMKPSAYLINTARGRLVDEKALVDALQRGLIAGAALDVFEEEPLPKDSPLRRLDNCLLAPHNANSSPKAYERVHANTIRNLLEGLRGPERKPNPTASAEVAP